MNKYIFFLLLFSTSILAQNKAKIDSVKVIVKEEKLHDTIISDSYSYLLRYYKRNNADSCLVYLKRLKAYADKNESNLGHYEYYRLKAGYFGLFPEQNADKYAFINGNLLQALEYAKKTKYTKLVFYTYSRLGQENVRMGKKEKALDYAKAAEKIAIEENYSLETARIYAQLGELYNLGFNKTDLALQYLLKSDSIYQSHDLQGNDRGSVLSYIGDVYSAFGDVDEARAYQEQALDIFIKTDYVFKQKFISIKLASIELLNKNYTKAIDYLIDGVAYYGENNYYINEAHCQVLLSEAYFESGQVEKALNAGQIAIDLNEKNNPDTGLLLALVNQTKILHEYGDYTKSNELAQKAEKLGLKLNEFGELKSVYEKMYLNAENLGDFENAYIYSKEHKRVSDTLVSIQNIESAKELEAQYKNTQQKQEIQLLQSQNELVEEQKRSQRNLLFAIIGFVFLVGLVLFFLFRNRQKTNQKLKELDTIKSNFFANISHEFRTPLTLISGPVEKQLENTKLDNSDRKDLEMVQRNSKRLLDLVDQLLDLSKLESGNLKLQVQEGNISLLLKSLTAAFQYKAENNSLNYKVDIQEGDLIWFDADSIEKIVVNLLSNAFKYVTKQGAVRFSSLIKDGVLEIEIENDGTIGSANNMESVFNRFYQEDDHADGVGIGLALVKELVALYRGTVTVKNTASKTVLFHIQLPVEKHQFSEHELLDATYEEAVTNQTEVSEIIDEKHQEDVELDSDTPILLVVEDNEDIRSFVKSTFESEFRVFEAEDGSEGIEKSIELIPDIIISDIMMPKVDGMELCKTLKSDERTSHIPIILLTAKIEEQAQHEGLELGADDYVLKPFKTKLLKTRVRNILKSRKQLRDRYRQEVVLKPSDISISRIDENFIEKVKEILDEHLTDSGFSIEEFSKKLTMSRMQLHRKIKALTGLTASEFVRSQRLHLAASLLKKSDVNISEICYQVGFNNHSYFTKCFKDTFGCLPSEYS